MSVFDYLRFLAALLFVLGLIIALYYVVRRFANSGLGFLAPPVGQRLSILETRTLDMRRRLMLVRRDDVEHLILLGQDGDIVIERGIPATGPHPLPDKLDPSRSETAPS